MKRLGLLLTTLFVSLFFFVPQAFAKQEKVDVYFFRGETCPHCQEAEEWFDSLDDKVKAKFNIIDYEVWYNADNSKLMNKVANVFGDTSIGVPYIIIGDKTFIGFTESYEEAILSQIDTVYQMNKEDRYDVMAHLDEASDNTNSNKEANDSKAAVIVIVFLVIACGGVLIYMVSKSN